MMQVDQDQMERKKPFRARGSRGGRRRKGAQNKAQAQNHTQSNLRPQTQHVPHKSEYSHIKIAASTSHYHRNKFQHQNNIFREPPSSFLRSDVLPMGTFMNNVPSSGQSGYMTTNENSRAPSPLLITSSSSYSSNSSVGQMSDYSFPEERYGCRPMPQPTNIYHQQQQMNINTYYERNANLQHSSYRNQREVSTCYSNERNFGSLFSLSPRSFLMGRSE
mmetsp:Transcript_10630/g.13461  ORF Transcript_10630/g.13461 Transcript_10630/m.13461 type:complete len:219 (+) Transcript_10630:68-724(+)